MSSDNPEIDKGAPAPELAATIGYAPNVPEQSTLVGAGPNPPVPAALDRRAVPDDYELLQEVARGGMGVVYKARQRGLNRVVALKMILAGCHASGSDIARFYREAESAAHLDHPGIVPIHQVGDRDGLPFIAMGFVDGPSLAQRLARGPLPPAEAVSIVAAIVDAVSYAHQHGVIHRDLKPANILLDPNSGPRVTDFGLAKREAVDSGLTASGQILGTPSYMPPEQAEGKTDLVGPLADVYALGAVLYASVTGRPPFQAASALETLAQVVAQEPVPPRQLNPAVDRDLDTIILKCLEKDPNRRYSSAANLAADLRRYSRSEPIVARASSLPYGLRTWLRTRLRTTFWVALMAAVSSFLMIYVVFSVMIRALLDMIPGLYARSFPSVRPLAPLGVLRSIILPVPRDSTLQAALVIGVIVLVMLARGPIFAWIAKPATRWEDVVLGLTAGLVSGAVFSALLGPMFGLMLGHVWSRDDLELLVQADRVARARPAREQPDPLVLKYGDLRPLAARSRASRVRYKISADSVAGQIGGGILGIAAAVVLGPVMSLAEAFSVGPLYRRKRKARAVFPAYAEILLPLLGIAYSLLLIALAFAASGFLEAQEDVTFLVLTAILSLAQLALAIYLVRSRVHWIKRWIVYAIAFGCLAAIALAAYD